MYITRKHIRSRDYKFRSGYICFGVFLIPKMSALMFILSKVKNPFKNMFYERKKKKSVKYFLGWFLEVNKRYLLQIFHTFFK